MRCSATAWRTTRFLARVAIRAATSASAVTLVACAASPAPGDGVHGIVAPLEGRSGDAARGRALVAAREPANCVLCHEVPGVALAGNLGPPLAGVGRRFDAAQLRLRVADLRRVVPETIMPSYHRTEGLNDVAPAYRGRPILDAQAVEDIVAYLGTLQ